MESQCNTTSNSLNSASSSLYQHLSADDIRLLYCKIADGTPLWLLETSERRTAPKYNALSYCWGNGVKQSPIVCNGHSIKVTSSVAGALQMIAQSSTQVGTHFWVDALCLNQEDEHEKAVHIARMSQIYAEACQVIVWLGEADSESDNAMINIRQILPILRSWDQHGGTLEDREVRDLGLPRRGYSTWYSIGRLLHRPWFSRLWPLQEVTFVKDFLFYCGTATLDWPTLRDFVHQLDRTGLLFNGVMEYVMPWKTSNIWWFVSEVRNLRETRVLPNPVDVLHIARVRSCDEPLDRLWAVLNFMQPNLRETILKNRLIDYSEAGKREFWKSYVEVAKIILMKHDPELSLLVLAEPHPEVPALPTWCPNFHSPGLIVERRQTHLYNAGFQKTSLKKRRPSVYGIHSGVLQVCGFGVDTVRYIIPEDWTFSSQEELQRGPKGFAAHLLKWDSLCHTVAAIAIGEPSWLQVYLETVTGNQSSKELLATSLQKQYPYWKDRMEHLVAGTDKKLYHPEWHICEPFFTAMQSTCAGRRFFSTEKGRIGIGPRQLAPGDKIYVLLQARPLFILRPCKAGDQDQDQDQGLSTNNSLIGHAYVHGLVHGEAFDLTDRGPDEVVNIC